MPDAFGVRFQEAIDNLKGKLPEVSLAWDSLAGPVHQKVFTVAGSTSVDLVRDLHQAVVQARANGTTITEFRKQFDQAVQDHGWTYKGKRGWRTQVIFDANMRSSAMAGRWQQLLANADRRPYLQYRTAGDARVRPQHRQWNGRIYPIGDAFWSTHYPPNGWGCRCTVRAYGQADLEANGLQVSAPEPIKWRDVRNRDGDLTDRVPVGIDPGWDHNVGRSWLTPELALGEKIASLPRELQGVMAEKTLSPAYLQAIGRSWNDFRAAVEAGSKTHQDAQIVGFLDADVLDGLAVQVPGLSLKATAVTVMGDRLDRLQAWPGQWVADLPAELRTYRAVLWDRTDQQLLVVAAGELPQQPGQVGLAALRPNATTNLGPTLSVEALRTGTLAELAAERYQVLVGRVD